jgi:hypothetical protein
MTLGEAVKIAVRTFEWPTYFRPDPARLLNAIAAVESSGGKHLGPRLEGHWLPRVGKLPAYASATQSALNDLASSHGAFQLLGITARELGFTGDLDAFRECHELNAIYAVQYLARRVFGFSLARNMLRNTPDFEAQVQIIGHAYNGGPGHVDAPNADATRYGDKLLSAYRAAPAETQGGTT